MTEHLLRVKNSIIMKMITNREYIDKEDRSQFIFNFKNKIRNLSLSLNEDNIILDLRNENDFGIQIYVKDGEYTITIIDYKAQKKHPFLLRKKYIFQFIDSCMFQILDMTSLQYAIDQINKLK